MDNDFNSQNSRNVMNVGVNHGTINVDDRKSQDNKQTPGNHSLVLFAIIISFLVFAVIVISIFTLRSAGGDPNQGVNSIANLESNQAGQNTNTSAANSNRENSQSNTDKSKSNSPAVKSAGSTNHKGKDAEKVSKNSRQKVDTQPQAVKTPNKPKPDTTPPDCVFTSEGCQSK